MSTIIGLVSTFRLPLHFASQSLYLWALWGFFFTYWGVNGDIFHYSSWKYLIWCWSLYEIVSKHASSVVVIV